MKSLYAYFGLLDLHKIDSPGHSLYQLGLMDSIRESFIINKFDFFSYYPEEVQAKEAETLHGYPETPLGSLFTKYRADLVDEYGITIEEVLQNIQDKKYDSLYLKARFRNLSTLQKKWKDARSFEMIIETALHSGYTKDKIIVLDTDLSLPESFYRNYGATVSVLIPSIDFPGISQRFLLECVEIHNANYNKEKISVFYGNIDTSSYKSGNSKSSILPEVIYWLGTRGEQKLTIISKERDFDSAPENTMGIKRNNRKRIWKALEEYLIMINVTKEKYNDAKFIPARIYEAMIFGMIPVSYKFNFLNETFSFETIDDLQEIIKYLEECEPEDLKKAYLHFIDSYLKFTNGSNLL